MSAPMQGEESFTLDEFRSAAWQERDEYASDSPAFAHVNALHRTTEGEPLEEVRFVGGETVFFVHLQEYTFRIYLYAVSGQLVGGPDEPQWAEPVMEVYGTTFDGVREMYGAANFTGSLPAIAKALIAIDGYLIERGWALR